MRHASIALLMLLWCPSLIAEVGSSEPLFTSTEVFPITLTGPLRAIAKDHSADAEFRPAELAFTGVDGVNHKVAIGLRARGKSRRDPDACNFPPLRLDLPKQGLEGTVFAGQNNLKLVTQCQSRDGTHRYGQNLLKEYVLYRVFNRLTELSFRVRLVQVTYINTDANNAQSTSVGFFIEDKDRLAQRNSMHVAKVPKINRDQLAPAQTNRVELFQFLIGNTDFSLLDGPGDEDCCHNAVPLLDADGKYQVVPYDFDATGVVDPPYARPAEVLKIFNVKERRYRGKCEPMAVFDETLTQFRDAKADIYALFTQQPDLQERVVKTVIAYLDDFYTSIDDPKQLERQILSECRK